MKFKSTWVLLLSAIAFGAYIYFVEIKKAAKDEDAKSQSEKIFTIEADKSQAIEFKNANGTIALEKDALNHWQIKSPVQAAADDQVVTSLLAALGSEKFDQVIDDASIDLKIYGLDNPKDTLTLTSATGVKISVKVGIDAALPGKIYLQRNSDLKILFASSSIKFQVEKSVKDLRDKRIIKSDKNQVENLEISYHLSGNNSHLKLIKKGGDWLLVKPISEKADQDTVLAFINSLDTMRAADFVSENSSDPSELKKFQLNAPAIEVTTSDKDGKPLEKLAFSGKSKIGNNVYITSVNSKSIYQFAASMLDSFIKPTDAFRDKKAPFEFKKDDVTEVLLKTSLVDFDLLKKNGSWELAKPETGKEVSQIQMTNFLEKVASIKINEFLDGELAKGLVGKGGPKGNIILKNAKGDLVKSFAWGEKTKSGKSYFLKVSGLNKIFAVDAPTIDSLPGQTLVEAKAPLIKPVASPRAIGK
jgi:hypothetical protein